MTVRFSKDPEASVRALTAAMRVPGSGAPWDAAELSCSADGKHGVFTIYLTADLEREPTTGLMTIDLETGQHRLVEVAGSNVRTPAFSPDGGTIAFLKAPEASSNYQLHFISSTGANLVSGPVMSGWVEALFWSPDGRRVLLIVADHGADRSGVQGAVPSQVDDTGNPSWYPRVHSPGSLDGWRRLWILDVGGGLAEQVSAPDQNVWEATWVGNSQLAVVASSHPDEGSWYTSTLVSIDLETRAQRELHRPTHQLGWPSGAPDGSAIAVVEAVCSDRCVVAGDLILIDAQSGATRKVDTQGIDVAHVHFVANDRILLAGHRGAETVFADYYPLDDTIDAFWSDPHLTTVGKYATVAPLPTPQSCAFLCEGFDLPPYVATIADGFHAPVASLGDRAPQPTSLIAATRDVRWQAPDGKTIQGWLLVPHGDGPHPLVMNIHGGPISHWRQAWLGRRGVVFLGLLERGYAVFFPNPRGSSGWGQAYAEAVVGDMGGKDTFDYLSGIDVLVADHDIDSARLCVMGVSYGGYMTAWLVCQSDVFAAAASICPVTNFVTEHLLSNIGYFPTQFLDADYADTNGKFYTRSPLLLARNVTTPTLNICGALDRCTPPEEARQFYQALANCGVETELIVYPEEGHGIRQAAAAMDYAARIISWFDDHIRLAGAENAPC